MFSQDTGVGKGRVQCFTEYDVGSSYKLCWGCSSACVKQALGPHTGGTLELIINYMFFFLFLILLYFTILYWFCHISK